MERNQRDLEKEIDDLKKQVSILKKKVQKMEGYEEQMGEQARLLVAMGKKIIRMEALIRKSSVLKGTV